MAADDGRERALTFRTDDGRLDLVVRVEGETVWLTQTQMAELFERDRSVITRHVRNVFREGELAEESNVQKVHFARSDKPTTLFSLDVILSVGYRVNSKRGTQFRIWATRVLRSHLIAGFSLAERRLRVTATPRSRGPTVLRAGRGGSGGTRGG